MFCGPAKRWFRLFVLKKGMCHLYLHLCVTLLVTVTESVTIAFWLHLPTQRYIGCHGFTKSLQTQMTQTHIPSFIHFFLMKTQEWKDCYVHRNIGIRGSNAKYETGMKELMDMFSRFYAYDPPPPPPPPTHTQSCVSGQWDWIKCFWKEKGFQGRFKRTDKRQHDGQKQGVGSRYLKPGNIYMLHAVLQTDPVRSQEMGRGNYT